MNDREPERNEKQSKSDKSKFDKSKIQCYMCHKMGHYKSECPQTRKLKESHIVEDIIAKGDEIPMRQEQKEAFLRATQNPVILEGKVDGKSVKEIYLDPGSSKTFVSQALVDQVSVAKKTVEVKTINPGRESYPVAHVNIEVAGYTTYLEVCVHQIFPMMYCWDEIFLFCGKWGFMK